MGMQGFRTKKKSAKQVSLSRLACLFAKSRNLRSITLRFNSWARDEDEKYHSAEPLLATLPWANLREVSLIGAFIHYHELIRHIEKLSPGTYILLNDVCLVSGVWVDLLDVLRGKADCNSSVIWMKGKEDERQGQTFGNMDEDNNPVSAYIRSQISHNPLRLPLVQDSTDSDYTIQGNEIENIDREE
jgi:hypothetical protein